MAKCGNWNMRCGTMTWVDELLDQEAFTIQNQHVLVEMIVLQHLLPSVTLKWDYDAIDDTSEIVLKTWGMCLMHVFMIDIPQ